MSSSDTVTKSSDCGRYCLSIFTRSGNSSRHGSQNVAQKLTSNGRSRCCVIKPLSASVSIAETTGKGFCCFAARLYFRWAGTAKPTSKTHNATGIATFINRMTYLRSFDAATESLRFCLLNCFARQRGVECVTQIVRLDLRGVACVVD